MNPRYGRCIQFPKSSKKNGKSFTKTRKAKFTGPGHGLSLVLNLDINQYTFASNAGNYVEI